MVKLLTDLEIPNSSVEIVGADNTAVAGTGTPVNIKGGGGGTSGTGGAVNLTGGAAFGPLLVGYNRGGAVNITSGAGAPDGYAGDLAITGAAGYLNGGAITLTSGAGGGYSNSYHGGDNHV